jgi:flagellin
MTLTGTTNTAAATALRYLAKNNTDAANSLSKLSSGSRIVRASDDAASLAVGTKIKADVTALKQASVNAGQASSLLQVADGGLSQVSDILMRMKALSVQSQSGSVGDTERGFLDKEFQALAKQIDAIGDQTKFNNTVLLGGNLTSSFSAIGTAIDGSGSVELKAGAGAQAGGYTVTYDHTSGELTVQQGSGAGAKAQTVTLDDTDTSYTGNVAFSQFGLEVDLKNVDLSAAGSDISANNTATVANGSLSFQVGVASTDTIDVSIGSIKTDALKDAGGTYSLADADGSGNAATIATSAGAVRAGDILDGAIAQLNGERADMGALMSRFDFASANLATSTENLDAARSTLMDVDMASEMSNFTSKQVLMQASVAMLAQANQMPQALLRLLQ